jgi:hypothetical protein
LLLIDMESGISLLSVETARQKRDWNCEIK